MAEEYQESEVVFQESPAGFEGVEDDDDDYEYSARASAGRLRGSRNKKQRRPVTAAAAARRESISLPVNIPGNWPTRTAPWVGGCVDAKEGGGSVEDDAAGEMVPPHVITGRRIAGKMMAFSVCTGNGRTLKGRDLSQVRNSVLRMTGFLET
ncbi:PREDICTED: uncharacterized protein LOC109158576 [Ipomoea nil]|uniref:uncharacterized protein LOC109158576 n=1 Tax=Ipomoea nil TaxID=35883 RepID=UPI0009013D63|nr:PREDICTED: uncharacterized protein LOC109158576 [Ipomoea nil]